MTDSERILLELGTIKGQLKGVLTALAAHSGRLDTHSRRLGKVEGKQSWVLGAATAASAILAAVVSFFGMRTG